MIKFGRRGVSPARAALKDAAQTFTLQQTFTQPLLLPDGTAGAPALPFTADPDTGLYRSGTNELSLSLGAGQYHVFQVGTHLIVGATARLRLNTDLHLERSAAGSLVIGGIGNGQALGVKQLTELLTIAAAASSDTTIQLPAKAIILGVSVRVTTAIPTAATFTVGDAGSADRFSTAAVAVAANSTDPGTKAGAYYNATAAAVRITPDLTPGANTGRVRVTIHYIDVNPATS